MKSNLLLTNTIRYADITAVFIADAGKPKLKLLLLDTIVNEYLFVFIVAFTGNWLSRLRHTNLMHPKRKRTRFGGRMQLSR